MVYMTPHPLEGTWIPLKAELAGNAAPQLALSAMKLVIAAGRYAVHFGANVADAGSYCVAAEAEFQTLTLFGEEGTNAGRSIPSIFQLVGDRLRICYGLDGTLPLAFASHTGSKCYLVTYRRAP